MSISINPNFNKKIAFRAENLTPVATPNVEKSKSSEEKTQEPKTESKPDAFDKKIDAIEEKTGIKHSAKTPKTEAEVKQETTPHQPIQEVQTKQSAVGQLYSKISTSSAIAKGVISGIIGGLYYGTFAAGADMIISGVKKLKNKEKDFKFFDIFKPKKSLSKSGRNLSILIAIGALVGQIIITVSKAKKQTEK